MFYTSASGAGTPRQLTQSDYLQWPCSFTPDGKRLVFEEENPETCQRCLDRVSGQRWRGAAHPRS